MASQLQAQSAEEIIRNMEEVMRGNSSYSEMTMTIERPRYTRNISLNAWSLGNDYSLILVTAPARDQGTVFLKREGEIWNFVPSIDRTIKMPPSMMSQSWMGSDFNNDDLVRESSAAEDYSHRITGEEEVDGRLAWVLELIPKEETAVVWDKVLLWVDQQEYIQLRMENFDQRGERVNTITFSDIRPLSDRMFPHKMTLIPDGKEGHVTTLVYEVMEFEREISPSFFTQQNMRRVR
ncbi:MAG: outer membrane lipoprotein-sorting protein [Balneolaceae bacterium]|nr:MAG: outer membrane lipoprotein-sorting protein [Balneolaceae bacterium]